MQQFLDFPWVWLHVDCDICKRAGRYRLARLAERYGAEITRDDLVWHLSIDCPRRRMKTMSGAVTMASTASPGLSISMKRPIRLTCLQQ